MLYHNLTVQLDGFSKEKTVMDGGIHLSLFEHSSESNHRQAKLRCVAFRLSLPVIRQGRSK